MGAGLVKAAIAYAVDVPLNPNEFRLLVGMALTALDDSTDDRPARRYFDSPEALALLLGRRVDDNRPDLSDEERRARTAALEAVKVALRGLVALGAIDHLKRGSRGRRAEYGIRLELAHTRRQDEYLERTRKEGSPFPNRKAHPSPIGRLTLPQSEGSPFPSGRTEEPQGQTPGRTPGPSRAARAPMDNSNGEAA